MIAQLRMAAAEWLLGMALTLGGPHWSADALSRFRYLISGLNLDASRRK